MPHFTTVVSAKYYLHMTPFFQRRTLYGKNALQNVAKWENTESDCKELVVFYYLPENDRREFVGK